MMGQCCSHRKFSEPRDQVSGAAERILEARPVDVGAIRLYELRHTEAVRDQPEPSFGLGQAHGFYPPPVAWRTAPLACGRSRL